MLPDFPALKNELAKHLHDALDRMVDAKAPLLAKIQQIGQPEGKIHAYDRIGAEPKSEGPETIAIPIKVELAEVPELVGDKLFAKLDALAMELAQKKMELFDRKFRESVEEVGNAFNANGAPLTQDMFLVMLERVDMDFGPDGRPTGEMRFTSPKADAAFQKWFSEPCFMSRYNLVLDRKRNEWRDRESNRKLVD